MNGPFRPVTPGSWFRWARTSSATISPVIAARRPTAVDDRGRQAGHALVEDEAADRVVVVLAQTMKTSASGRWKSSSCCRTISSRRERLRARVARLPGSGRESGSVSPKQPIHLPPEFGQVFLLLFLGTESVDGQYDQRGLHAEQRPVGRIDALDLAGDQAVGHIVEAGAAVLRRGSGREGPMSPISRKMAGSVLCCGRHRGCAAAGLSGRRPGGVAHLALIGGQL